MGGFLLILTPPPIHYPTGITILLPQRNGKMKLTDMNLWKALNILSAIVTVIICAFLDTNPTYAIIPMLMAIFLAIEDRK